MSSTVAGNLSSSANIMTNGKQPKLEMKPGGMGAKGMSAANGPSSATSGVSEKHESWQMELLMERLRSKAKSSQYKSFQEMSKSARMSLLEKRYALDAVEKSNLQKTLDSMQYCIKVTSRQGLVERLDCLTRQLGLKLSEDTSGLFISSDMFYLEIILDQNGTVQDVKVHHECKMKQQSCSELVSCLQRGDFVDFTTQLEGLASIYQLNAEKKIKVNAFVALQALETDLYNLYSLSTQHFSDIHSLLLKSPLGVVQKRRGGHAMKLTYFVAPYDLLDLEAKKMKPLNTELLSAEKIGYSVSVNLEASTANKLQIQPLLVQQGNSPMYSPIEKHNSTSLPATFVLRLNKPIALNVAALKQISAITGDTTVGTADKDQSSSMMSLIIQHDSNGAINNVAKGLFVTLPDQYHCYYMSENKNVQGVIVSSIPFTEPQHVPKILVFLRQQALFNQLLTSCIRNNGSSNTRISDYENLLVFEIAALSCQNITVSLEHPYEESLAMVELDLRNSLAIQVRIFCNGYECDDIISHRISLVMQRTISIPITLRALIKIWEQEYEAKFKGKLGLNAGGNGGNDESNFSLPMGPDEGGGNGSGGPGGGGGGSGLGLNGQHAGSMNGVVIAHQECSDAKKIKLEPLDSAKKRRTGEDFRHSPKSSKVETKGRNGDDVPEVEKDDDCDESTNMSSGDSSNSLGGNQSNATQQTSSSSSSSSSLLSSGGISMTVETPGDTNQLLTNKSAENTDFSSLDAGLMRSSNSSDAAGSNESSLVLKKHQAPKPADEKPSFTSSVSITPIAVGKPNLASNSVLNIGLDKRPGIEIIPLAGAGSSMSSSVTITPIPIGSSIGSSKSGSSEKRVGGTNISGSGTSRKSSESDRAKLEKKKKRKHEEQLAQLQMGPPHKILSKNASSDGPTSPSGSSRKFTASPVPSKSGGTSSGQHLTGGSPSPKHSPVHHSSPKHQGNYGTSSPKHVSGGSSGGGKPSMSALKSAASGGSPSSKGTSSGIGGKEEGSSSSSSSASGMSNKTSSGSTSSRDRDRERDRERSDKKSGYSSSSSSPKLKTPAVKLKQLDLANCGTSLSSGVQLELMNSNSSGGSSAGSCSIDFSDAGLFGANATDLSKSSSVASASAASMLLLQHAMKNKKSSLSAVIDKLKSAHSGDESTLMLLPELAQQAGFTIKETSVSGKSASPSTTASTTTSVPNLSASSSAATTTASFAAHLSGTTIQGKSNEYMVKPSSDGIKLTIQNKKGSKSSSSSSASSKSSSKSGLKPGVSSGPVSKKLQSSQSFSGSFPSSSSSSSIKSSSSGSSSSKVPFQKSSSSGSLVNTGSSLKPSSKSSSNSSSSSSSSGSKDKSRSSSKSSSSSSSSSSSLMTTNTAMAVSALNVMKMIGFTPSIQNMEGFVKTLDTKFQIPKLSARSGVSGSDTDKLKDSRPASSSAPNTPLSNVSQSPTGANDFSLPFNKLPGDVSPLHSAMLPNVMQKMFSAHDNAMLLRRSPNLDHQTSNSRDGFPSLYGKGPTTPTTPTTSVAPSFPSPVGLQGHAMDFSSSSDSIDGSNLMRPPSRPSSTLSNHSSSDKLIDGTASSNSMDGLSGSSSAQAITAAAVAAQFINKLDNTQHTQLVAALKNHHLNALSNAAAAAAAAAAASNSAGSVPVTSPASVSVHIVKSPAASPLPLHGGSGNAVDDELMDEALIGIGGK